MSKRQKTVLVITAGDHKTASSKYRAFLLGKYLSKIRSDIVWKFVTPSTKAISAMGYVDQVRHAWRQSLMIFWRPQHDAVFIQRALYNKFIFVLLILQNILRMRPSTFDFDDAIFTHSPFKTRWLVQTSNAVIVGSHHLYEYARQYNKNVTLIPTCIKFSDYAELKKVESDKTEVTLGWIGNGPAYIPELRFIAEVLRILQTRGTSLQLLLIGAYHSPDIREIFDFISSERKSIIDYVDAQTDADLVPYFAKMDIGLMPLEANPWNKGKCAFKAVQYMAAGVAVIASPVGENSILIEHRKTGILATTKGEWTSSLQELINNPALRRELGIAAQARVREHYSYESQCEAVGGVIDSVTKKNSCSSHP